MTPGQLVKAVSIALDVPEETVVQHDRNLVMAGLRTTGARGRNAPDVTTRDAARLFVATLASVRTKDSVDMVQAYEETKFRSPKSQAAALEALAQKVGRTDLLGGPGSTYLDPAIMSLPENHNLVDAIAALITDATLPLTSLEQHLERFAPLMIMCTSSGARASISHMAQPGGSATYDAYDAPPDPSRQPDPKFEALPKHERYAQYYGIRQDRKITGTAIMLLGKAFRDNGLPFKTTRDALDALLGIEKAPTKARKRA
jgi:hypothetical protein